MKASEGFTRLQYTAINRCRVAELLAARPVAEAAAGRTAYAVGRARRRRRRDSRHRSVSDEPATLARLGCIALIVTGVLGLKRSARR